MKCCLKCNKEILDSNKFCSRSCSASFNNSKRKHSEETKSKISKGVGGTGIPGEAQKIRYERLYNSVARNPKQFLHNLKLLNDSFYEPFVKPILEKEFGYLGKECIENKVFDFANESVLIEITFDHTRGINNIIDRFRVVLNDGRRKIAYVPSTHFGKKRRNLLTSLGVEIRQAEDFSACVQGKSMRY